MEAELLKRLHMTQKKEKDAFGELENAMMNAAVPLRHRVVIDGSQSQPSFSQQNHSTP